MFPGPASSGRATLRLLPGKPPAVGNAQNAAMWGKCSERLIHLRAGGISLDCDMRVQPALALKDIPAFSKFCERPRATLPYECTKNSVARTKLKLASGPPGLHPA